MVYIIKKDGTREEFNAEKIVRAVSKSADRVMYKFTDEEIEKELYKVDLRRSKERAVIMDLSDLDIRLNEHVKIRVIYDIFGTEIKLVER